MCVCVCVCVCVCWLTAEFPEVSERGKEADQKREGERNGILRGLKLAVSCLFPSEDQSLATSVLQEHSGTVYV